jgi:hypothetical protein
MRVGKVEDEQMTKVVREMTKVLHIFDGCTRGGAQRGVMLQEQSNMEEELGEGRTSRRGPE